MISFHQIQHAHGTIFNLFQPCEDDKAASVKEKFCIHVFSFRLNAGVMNVMSLVQGHQLADCALDENCISSNYKDYCSRADQSMKEILP